MAISKTINIDGKEVAFKASAALPRQYLLIFRRDLFKDLKKLEGATSGDPESSDLGTEELIIFENIAYLMAKYADPSIPDSPDEWLDSFGMFSIYMILPQILELWGLNNMTTVESKKNIE